MSERPRVSIPVVEGLFAGPPERPYLIGTRCTSCGAYYFPKSTNCNNPLCREKKVEEVALSRRGVLWSYTIQYYPPPPPFRMDEPFSPYAIGLVELPEGIRVLGMISIDAPEALRPGMEMELVLEGLYHDDVGNEVVTWKFRPVQQSHQAIDKEAAR